MAEPTVTLAQLRRAVGRQTGMRFYRYGNTGTISAQTGNHVEDNDLLAQVDDFWNRSWFYVVTGSAAQESRMILDSRQADRSLTLEFPPTTMSVSDEYEILDAYSPAMVHEAINEALREAWPHFFETLEDTSLCVGQDLMEYDISGLGAFMVNQVWIERPDSIARYETTGTNTTLYVNLDTSEDISQYAFGDWWITIFDANEGAGLGYARAISAIDNNLKRVSWTTATPLASPGARVTIFNAEEKNVDWYPAHACDFDNKQWPDTMRFKVAYDNFFVGSRIMLRYITVPAELSAEADTTAVPIDYVVARARAMLYDWHKDDTRQDRQRFDANFTDQMVRSEAIKANKAFQAPDQLFWTEDDPALQHGMWSDSDGDPLGWSNF